ncbi:MAG: leucine-rich repeat domain-containing protein [Thermoanaerobaculia bacterium]
MRRLSLFLAGMSLALAASIATAAIPSAQRDALIAIYNSTGGANWSDSSNWLGSAGTECSWYGVGCSEDESTVVELSLDYNGLTGTLPSDVARLSDLRTLYLEGNQLTGTLPPEIGNLSSLENLAIYENQLSGSLPSSIGNLPNLISFEAATNRFSGAIPPSLGNLAALQTLMLYSNQLTGAIPPEIGNLRSLQILSLADNFLSGSIPSQLGDAISLQELYLNHNQLTGSIPPSVGSLANLQILQLSENRLTGSIPPETGDLSNLTQLELDTNQLTGTIPKELGNLSLLERLWLHQNLLSGSIPPELGELAALDDLLLSSNRLTASIPKELANLTTLTYLALDHNQLTGSIPSELGTLHRLEYLDLGDNQLTGSIPVPLGDLSSLRSLVLASNQLTGTIPSELGQLSVLDTLALGQNQLTGSIPAEIGSLTKLQSLSIPECRLTGSLPSLAGITSLREILLYGNQLSGDLPSWLGEIPSLEMILLGGNEFTGSIPPGITSLANLTYLDLAGNRIGGTIPSDIGNLARLEYLTLGWNRLTGPIPSSIGELVDLTELHLDSNLLSGAVPSLENLSRLQVLLLGDNELTGTIPTWIGSFPQLQYLSLGSNHFTGPIPDSIGGLASIIQMDLSQNVLSGPVPSSITLLETLEDGGLDVSYNALYTSDGAVLLFLNRKQEGSWQESQTVAPTGVAPGTTTDRSITLSWHTIEYGWDEGGYQAIASLTPGGAPVSIATTPDKWADSVVIRGLAPSTKYYLRVRSVTHPHGYQKNVVTSEATVEVTATTTAKVNAPAEVVLTSPTSGLIEIRGVPQNQDAFVLTNFGDVSTTVTLERDSEFFEQSPTSFTLAGGASQTVTVTAVPQQPLGPYWGYSVPSGDGVPEDLEVVIRMLSVATTTGTATAEAVNSRIDLSGDVDTNAVGTVTFRNVGTAPLTGILVSDVPWLVPPQDIIDISSGDIALLNFQVERSKRTIGSADGTVSGNLKLIYVSDSGSAARALLRDIAPEGTTPPGVSFSLVTVVDTTRPSVAAGTIPPLAAGEIARFIPGIRDQSTSSSRSFSDLSIANAFASRSISDLKLYYSRAGMTGTSVASIGSVAPNQALTLASVVNGVYTESNQSGTLQIRTREWTSILAEARSVTTRAGRGTVAGSIPIFRSDRSVAPGGTTALTALEKGAGLHTDLYIQETSGQQANVKVRWLSGNGMELSSSTAQLEPFGVAELADAAPSGAVSAIVSNDSGSSGRIVAYAAATDETSGDRWALVDWPLFFGYSSTSAVRLPLVRSATAENGGGRRRIVRPPGTSTKPLEAAASASIATDLTLFNPGSTAVEGTLRYLENGVSISRDVTLAPLQTRSWSDVAKTLFGRSSSAGGSIVFTPRSGGAVMESRMRSGGSNGGSIGAAIPAVAATSGLRLGQSRVFAGLEDSTRTTVAARLDGTWRTGFGILESGGASIRVRATLRFQDGRAFTGQTASKDFSLSAGQLMMADEMARSIIGADRETRFGNLHDVQLELELVEGDGAATVFVISVDNGSGDSIFRAE